MKIKIRFKKIQRHRGKDEGKIYGLAWGTFDDNGVWIPSGKIDLDPRQKGKRKMDSSIHELIHTLNPEFSETKVKQQSKIISAALWDELFCRFIER